MQLSYRLVLVGYREYIQLGRQSAYDDGDEDWSSNDPNDAR